MIDEKKKNNGIIIVFLVIALLCSCGYIVYDKFIVKKDKTIQQEDKNISEQNKEKEEIELDINSGLVQTLYSNIVANNSSCFLNIIVSLTKETLLASDISVETKWKMGYDLVVESQKSSIDCNKYPATTYFKEDQLSDAVGCGDYFYNSITKQFEAGANIAYTEFVLEDDIKKRVNQIFGPNTYQHMEEITVGGTVYKYVAQENGYVKLTIPAGGICEGYDSGTLRQAIKKDDRIIITEDVVDKNNEKYVFIYTYKLGQDDSYYFYSLEKK